MNAERPGCQTVAKTEILDVPLRIVGQSGEIEASLFRVLRSELLRVIMGQAVNVVLALVISTSLAGWKPVLIFAAENRTQVTGPATEKRFPPLRVPDGFRATLFACDPLVEYPSVISIGPNQVTINGS